MLRSGLTDGSLQDLRHAIRKLIRKPGFTVLAALSLALGIGANTAIFSVVNAVLLRSLPYEEPERLVRIWETFISPNGRGRGTVSIPNFRDWQEQNHSFVGLGGYSLNSFNLMTTTTPTVISGARVTPETFQLLGIKPVLGRTIRPDIDTKDSRVAVLSHSLWRNFFGGDPDIVGQVANIDGEPFTWIGVMPPEFDFPPRSSARLWAPLTYPKALGDHRDSHWLNTFARLKPGVTLATAQSDMEVIARFLEQEYPDAQDQRGITMQPLAESVVARTRPVLLALWSAVGFVLLIACVNVANLLLARTADREREFAVRAALGAGRRRLMQQVLLESLVLAIAGGVLGLVVGYSAVRYLATFPGARLLQGQEITIDFKVLAICAAISILAAALSGILPAFLASKLNLQGVMKERSSATSVGRHRDPIRAGFVVVELALALVVLIGASLVLRSFLSLRTVDPGLMTHNVLTLRIPLSGIRYVSPEDIRSFYDRLLERIRALPGVQSVGMINVLPIQNWGWNGDFFIHGRQQLASGRKPFAEFRRVGGEYFETFDIPLVSGRLFDPRDHADAPPVILVNQSLARRYWPDENPVGQQIGFGVEDPDKPPITIIGVVGDVKNAGLAQKTKGEAYLPFSLFPDAEMTLVVRSNVDPTDLTPSIRHEIQSIDPEQPIYRVATMDEVVSAFLSSWRFNAVLFTFFAALALVLAMLGVYGILSYNVSQRTYEIGVRMALGAHRSDILGLFVKRGLWLSTIGAACGIVIAVGLTRFLSSQLYGVKPVDLLTFTLVTFFLLAVAFVACSIPACRASTVEPMIALHYE